jgi:hypothetical protein
MQLMFTFVIMIAVMTAAPTTAALLKIDSSLSDPVALAIFVQMSPALPSKTVVLLP